MSQTEQTQLAQEEIEETVLDAVQKGFTKVSDLVSYTGPELIDINVGETERELDVPQVMRAIQRLIQRGYLNRVGRRGIEQLEVRLTDEGREAAPSMPERERELVTEYGVPLTALEVLASVVEYEQTHGSVPSVSDLRAETDVSLVTYQLQPLFTRLIDAGLAEASGLFRFKLEPTDEGRTVVEEYRDLLAEE